jgi:integrase
MGARGSKPRHPGVEARGDSIRLRFNYRGRRSETLRLPPTPANLTYASRLRSEILRKIELGVFKYADYFPGSAFAIAEAQTSQNFLEASELWLETADLEKSTREGYLKILKRHVWPWIGSLPIHAITEMHIYQLLAAVDASKKTRNNVLITVRRPFALAGLQTAERIEYARHQTPLPDPFSPAEVERILAKLGALYGEQVEAYFGVAFFTGARTSELLAMRWEDIDFNQNIWRVRRAWVRKEEKGTKTSRERDHELSVRARQYLDLQAKHTRLQGGRVFMDPVTGRPYIDDKPPRERYWRPALKLLGMRYREPYQTRHTYITTAVMGGASPSYVAAQAGNSVAIIYKHYFRWLRLDGRERGKIDAAQLPHVGQTTGETGGNQGVSAAGGMTQPIDLPDNGEST